MSDRLASGRRRKSLVVYLTAGYPSREIFLRAARVARDEGADWLEVGLPFSDPVADGPVIQKTSMTAISKGVNLDVVLDMAEHLPEGLPRMLMTYANPLFVRGWTRAFRELWESGFNGCVIPDVPAEELRRLIPHRPAAAFSLVPFVAPTTSDARLKTIIDAGRQSAFIYMVSLRGITGGKSGSRTEITRLVQSIRRRSSTPVFIGFGVRTPADAGVFADIADGVIVGTAALQALDQGIPAFARFVRGLRRGLDRAA